MNHKRSRQLPTSVASTSEMIYEIDHILNFGYESSEGMSLAVMNSIFAMA